MIVEEVMEEKSGCEIGRKDLLGSLLVEGLGIVYHGFPLQVLNEFKQF